MGEVLLAERAALFGRKVPNEPERGTVRLDHESISREHAAIVHSFTGETFLVDLGSRYGTKLDGSKLEPKKYTPVKEGAQIIFGDSTRIYTFTAHAPKGSHSSRECGALPTSAVSSSKIVGAGVSSVAPQPAAKSVASGNIDDEDDVDPMANYVRRPYGAFVDICIPGVSVATTSPLCASLAG